MQTLNTSVRGFSSGRCLVAVVLLAWLPAAPALFVENTQPGFEGTLKFEAETFDARSFGFYGDPPSAREWTIIPDERGAFPSLYSSAYGGRYLQVRIDAGSTNAAATPFDDGPTVTYEIQILTAGTYTVLTRFSGHDVNSDSVWLRVREATGYFQLVAPNDNYRDSNFADSWQGEAATAHGGANGTTIEYTLGAGTYHLDYAMGEDGFSMDQILLTRKAAFTGEGDANKLAVPLSVPEPAAAFLMALGTGVVLRRRSR